MIPTEINVIFDSIEVGEIWGVGRKLNAHLQQGGIRTVKQLRDIDVQRLRNRFGVVMERTVRELRGISYMEMADIAPPKQQIISSRSFGRNVTELNELEEAVSTYMSRAAEKLRRQNSVAATTYVYIRTNPHREREPQHCQGMMASLPHATNDTCQLVGAVLAGLRRIYRTGFSYQKVGVMLSDITPAEIVQGDLFANHSLAPGSSNLMTTLDQINIKLGKGALKLASEGIGQGWKMKTGNKNPTYTTKWAELPIVR